MLCVFRDGSCGINCVGLFDVCAIPAVCLPFGTQAQSSVTSVTHFSLAENVLVYQGEKRV